jgi:hypothetical protein
LPPPTAFKGCPHRHGIQRLRSWRPPANRSDQDSERALIPFFWCVVGGHVHGSGILGHIPDEENPEQIPARLVNVLAPGSYLVINDGTNVLHGQAGCVLRGRTQAPLVPDLLQTPDYARAWQDHEHDNGL